MAADSGTGNDNDINGIADDRLSTGRPQGAGNVAGVKRWVWPGPNTPPHLPFFLYPLHYLHPPSTDPFILTEQKA